MSDILCHDPAAIEKLERLAGHEFVVEMLDLFFDYAPNRIAAAREAWQAGDLHGVEQAVHPLKASALHVGAQKMNALAKQMEQMAREKNAAPLTALFAEIEAAFAEVKPILQTARAASAAKLSG